MLTIKDVIFGFDSLVELVFEIGYVVFDLLVEFGAILSCIQLQVVLLDGPPETLNPSVVGDTTLPYIEILMSYFSRKEVHACEVYCDP